MSEITEGSDVLVRTFDGRTVGRVAVTGIVRGDDFLVVWVCTPDEWRAARAESREPSAVPWPAPHVAVAGP